ncbi:MAG: nucleotide exchange factor GrpE [Dialister sp.]|nr:nucleotide exchange factor GrpE [Dialister sp.]
MEFHSEDSKNQAMSDNAKALSGEAEMAVVTRQLQDEVEGLKKEAAEAKEQYNQALAEKEKLQEQAQALTNQYVRLQADFDNFRRRTRENEARASDTIEFATLEKFLPVLDNFDIALKHLESDEAGKAYAEGFALINRQLVAVMTDFGVSEIDAEGKHFDPHFHEAVMPVVNPELPEDTVAMVFQKGYMYKDEVLRPSKVQVVHNE